MATQDTVLRELNFLGIDETTVEVLALLPLIQVAWADGEVQEAEREKILGIARDRYHLGEDGAHLLEDWLRHPPSATYLERGRRILVALAHTRDDFDLKPDHLVDVVDFSKQVAEAAGGFLGFRSIDKREASALEDIAAALHVTHSQPVGDLATFEEDVEDEVTDVRSPEQMDEIRAAVTSAVEARDLASQVGVLVHHQEDDASFPIDATGLSIGRSRANIIQLQHDGEISRFHCKIVVDGERCHIEDNGTTNGTWVNGERVSKRRLFGAETITVGAAEFTFQLG